VDQAKHLLQWHWVAGCPVTPIDGLIKHETWSTDDITSGLIADITVMMVTFAVEHG